MFDVQCKCSSLELKLSVWWKFSVKLDSSVQEEVYLQEDAREVWHCLRKASSHCDNVLVSWLTLAYDQA